MHAPGHPHPAFEAAAIAAVVAARSLDEAVDRLEVLDLLCSTWHAAWLAGGDPGRRVRGRPLPGAALRTPSPIRRRP